VRLDAQAIEHENTADASPSPDTVAKILCQMPRLFQRLYRLNRRMKPISLGKPVGSLTQLMQNAADYTSIAHVLKSSMVQR
jgi:hypothetical protein